MKHFSVEKQRNLANRLGLDPDEYDSDNQKIVNKFLFTFTQAQISGDDAYGNPLSSEDFELLSVLTGRG
jgi:hypothetical protein